MKVDCHTRCPFRLPNSDVTSTTNSYVATKLGSNFIICLFLKLFHVLLTLVVKVAWICDHQVLFFLRFAFEKKRKRKRKKNKNHCLISQAQLLSYLLPEWFEENAKKSKWDSAIFSLLAS